MTKSVMPDGKLHKSQWPSPTILIRVGSILMVGLMIGHMSAYPWTFRALFVPWLRSSRFPSDG
jgi:hypothetical protein